MRREADTVIVQLVGELDIAGSKRLRARLRKERAEPINRVILDLSRLNFMDGWGLRTIIEANTEAIRSGGMVQIVKGPPAVHKVFKLTGFDTQLNFLAPAGNESP